MNNRDDFTKSTKELLAKRVGYRCSNPDCRCLTISPKGKDDTDNCGQAAHIAAASPGGPRYDPKMSKAERKSFKNGIWLCYNCATKIDRNPSEYPKKMLMKWKKEAENFSKLEYNNPTNKFKIFIEEEKIKIEENSLENSEWYKYEMGELDDFEITRYEEKQKELFKISTLFDSCKRTKSWDNQSYLHLYEYCGFSEYEINNIDTINLSFQELVQIRKGLEEYLLVHIKNDEVLAKNEFPIEEKFKDSIIIDYIKERPGSNIDYIFECTKIDKKRIKETVWKAYEEGKINSLDATVKVKKSKLNEIYWIYL